MRSLLVLKQRPSVAVRPRRESIFFSFHLIGENFAIQQGIDMCKEGTEVRYLEHPCGIKPQSWPYKGHVLSLNYGCKLVSVVSFLNPEH